MGASPTMNASLRAGCQTRCMSPGPRVHAHVLFSLVVVDSVSGVLSSDSSRFIANCIPASIPDSTCPSRFCFVRRSVHRERRDPARFGQRESVDGFGLWIPLEHLG